MEPWLALIHAVASWRARSYLAAAVVTGGLLGLTFVPYAAQLGVASLPGWSRLALLAVTLVCLATATTKAIGGTLDTKRAARVADSERTRLLAEMDRLTPDEMYVLWRFAVHTTRTTNFYDREGTLALTAKELSTRGLLIHMARDWKFNSYRIAEPIWEYLQQHPERVARARDEWVASSKRATEQY